MNNNKKISFTIIAHVDHGKSTLSDRILEICNAKDPLKKEEQLLDNMDIEQERGITIKSQAVQLHYKGYTLYINDTPGHVDFSHEVHRSLLGCDTSILLIDATQGVQAQTLAHLYKAVENNHIIIPVLNKIDLGTANVDACKKEIEDLGINLANLCMVSAKTGAGVEDLLNVLIRESRPMIENAFNLPVQARIIDSWYDNYAGIVFLIRIFTGKIKVGDTLTSYHGKNKFLIKKICFMTPHEKQVDQAEYGDIVNIVTATKIPSTMPGDLLYDGKSELNKELVERTISIRPIVFYTLYLEDTSLTDSAMSILKKYQLNDPAFMFTVENSLLYGICFNAGFLGMLHCEIVKERLNRHFGLKMCTTAPSVEYKLKLIDGKEIFINNHKQMPNYTSIVSIQEPYTKCTIFLAKNTNIGEVLDLCVYKRAMNTHTQITDNKIIITCNMPLIEVITNFNDKLKSLTSGYASLEYELTDYKDTNISKLVVAINNNVLSDNGLLIHESRARRMANLLAQNLKEILPRSQVSTKIQIIDSKTIDNRSKNILASAEISAYRKDVTSHCSGGDISRKKKLLEQQKAGKARRAEYGSVNEYESLSNTNWSKAATKAQNSLDN